MARAKKTTERIGTDTIQDSIATTAFTSKPTSTAEPDQSIKLAQEREEHISHHAADEIDKAIDAAHVHINKSILDKFGESNGQLIFGGNIIGGISDAPSNDLLYGRKNKNWEVIPAHSVDLMFFGVENGNSVVNHTAPTSAQTIIPSGTHFPANPGVWHDVITFTIGRDLHGTELEFIPGNLFTAKIWLRSDMLRDKAQFRLSAMDVRTNTSLAVGTGEIDLGQTGELQPLIIPGFYEVPAVVPAEYIRMNLQVLSPLFGVQIGLFSIPPNEIAYISRLISSVTVKESALILNMLLDKVQELTKRIDDLEKEIE